MTEPFEPDAGWRPIVNADLERNPEYIAHYDPKTHETKMWVRNEPDRPLPTVKFSVIRVTWKVGAQENNILILNEHDVWQREHASYTPERLLHFISDYELVSSPWGEIERKAHEEWKNNVKRVTAKEILTRRQELRDAGHEFPDEQIAAENGFEWA